VLRTLLVRTATLVDDRRLQRQLNSRLAIRIAALEGRPTEVQPQDGEADDLLDDQQPLAGYDRRFNQIDDQLTSSREQFDLMNGKLDVILDLLQTRP
jgi:hypothetical protein